MILGPMLFTTQMPLAHMPRLIAAIAQGGSEAVLAGRQFLQIGNIDDGTPCRVKVTVPVDPVGDADGGRVFSRQQARAGR